MFCLIIQIVPFPHAYISQDIEELYQMAEEIIIGERIEDDFVEEEEDAAAEDEEYNNAFDDMRPSDQDQ